MYSPTSTQHIKANIESRLGKMAARIVDHVHYSELDKWAKDNVLVDGLAKDLCNNLLFRDFQPQPTSFEGGTWNLSLNHTKGPRVRGQDLCISFKTTERTLLAKST